MLVTGLMTVAGFIGSGTPSSISSGFGHYSLNIFAPFFGTGDSYTQQLLGPVTISMPPEGNMRVLITWGQGFCSGYFYLAVPAEGSINCHTVASDLDCHTRYFIRLCTFKQSVFGENRAFSILFT